MRQPSSLAAVLLTAALAGLHPQPGRAELTPVELEIRVDDDRSIPDPVECPQLAIAPNGGFVVAWTPAQVEGGGSCQPDGAIFGRFFNPEGVPRAPRPSLITMEDGNCFDDLQLGPFIDGSAVALWRESFGELDPFSSLVGASFSALGGFDSLPLLPQAGTPAGMLSSGGFVFLFSRGRQPGFDAERYDRHGALVGKRFTVAKTSGRYTGFGVAETADSGLIVTWITDRRADGRTLVAGRRFDRQGRGVGREIEISDRTSSPNITHPSLVAASESGSFMVGWTGGAPSGDALVRVFNPNGSPRSPVVRGNTSTGGEQVAGSLAARVNGDFVMTWQRLHRPLRTFELIGRLFAPDGTLLGNAVPLPSQGAGYQECGTIRTNGHGLWIAAWLGDGPQGKGVYVRRFSGTSGTP